MNETSYVWKHEGLIVLTRYDDFLYSVGGDEVLDAKLVEILVNGWFYTHYKALRVKTVIDETAPVAKGRRHTFTVKAELCP